jgi:hypothetical protein
MAGFSWLTFGQAKAELATRLSNENPPFFWSDAERGLYIAWAMRIFNCLTAFFVAEYPITLQSPFVNWNAANGSGSPRQPILSDIDIYTMMEYMLLEPPTGGTWTGTNQFSIEALAQAVQGRRDETLQVGATNVAEITLPLTPGTSRATLPDTALDVLRVRWVPATGQGSPAVLQRGDAESFRTFTPGYLQTTEPPLRWDVISGPPLALTLDTLSPVPATLQVLIMQAEPVPAPPAATPLGMPDDWAWVPLFGALADVLAAQEEARDTQRAEYARKRYLEGMAWLKQAPWLMEARITNVPVATPSVVAADRFNYGWQTNSAAFPQVVVAGVDLYGVSPPPTADTSVMLVVVANAPIPTADNQDIQVPRDVMDALLDESEHLATFKMAGSDFATSLALHESFLATAKRWNARIRESGIFATTLRSEVPRGEVQQPRFAETGKE